MLGTEAWGDASWPRTGPFRAASGFRGWPILALEQLNRGFSEWGTRENKVQNLKQNEKPPHMLNTTD